MQSCKNTMTVIVTKTSHGYFHCNIGTYLRKPVCEPHKKILQKNKNKRIFTKIPNSIFRNKQKLQKQTNKNRPIS